MPVITMPGDVRAVSIEGPYVEINGRSAPDVILRMAELTTGLAPTSAQVAFPNVGPLDSPVRLGDVVQVWLNRWGGDFPVFVGRVRGTPVSMDPQEGRICGADALSLAADLMDGICSRDFNAVDERTGHPKEILGLRTIAKLIFDEYLAFQAAEYSQSDRPLSQRIQLDLPSFPPNGEVGEFMVKGVPHGQALEELVHTFGDGTWRTKVEYTQSGYAVLRCYQIGQGMTYYLVSPTDSFAHPSQQPEGRANVNTGHELVDNSGTENIIELEGARRLFEQAVPLGPRFDTSLLDTYAARAEAAAAGAALGKAGAEDPALEAFARQWVIPTYMKDLDDSDQTLEADRTLLQAEQGGPIWGDRPKGPAVIYRWSSAEGLLSLMGGSGGVKTGAGTFTITGEQEGSDRFVGQGIRVGDPETGTDVLILAQDGNTLTGNFNDVDAEENPHDWTVFDGQINDWRVMQGGVRVEGNVVTLNKPLVEKVVAARTTDIPIPMTKLDLAFTDSLTEGGATIAKYTHVLVRNEQPTTFELTSWADESRAIHSAAGGVGDPMTIVLVTGKPTSAQLREDDAATTAFVDATNRYIYRLFPIGELTDAQDFQDQCVQYAVAGVIPSFVNKGQLEEMRVHLRMPKETGQWAVPDQVYLEATWKSRVPFVVTSDAQGTDDIRVKRRRQVDGFVYKVKRAPWFELEADDIWSPGVTVTATLNDGEDEIVRDDTTRLTAAANRMAKVAAEPARTMTRKLPLMPTGMKVGMQLRENGVPLDANIRTVRWDFIEAVTYIEAMTH